MVTFEELKKHLSDMKRDHMFINMEYFLDTYGENATCYNYLMSAYWKIAQYNLDTLKERYPGQ